jgi:hypothetical protein
MKAEHLLKLANIATKLEVNGLHKESDAAHQTLVRLAAYWQAPYADIPMLERKWPFSLVDEDFEDAEESRTRFPRYEEKDDVKLSGDDSDEGQQSLEVSLHPKESNPGAGIKFVWPDFASSLQQGKNWGKDIKKHDENNASCMRYKNLVPTFY